MRVGFNRQSAEFRIYFYYISRHSRTTIFVYTAALRSWLAKSNTHLRDPVVWTTNGWEGEGDVT